MGFEFTGNFSKALFIVVVMVVVIIVCLYLLFHWLLTVIIIVMLYTCLLSVACLGIGWKILEE